MVSTSFPRLSASTVSHSQITIGVQLALTSVANASPSRRTFSSNLCFQNSTRDLGVRVELQPGCRCQKQPWTKIAIRRPASTMSGDPHIVRTFVRYRSPAACKARRTRISGLVSLLRTRDITALRSRGSRTTAAPFVPPRFIFQRSSNESKRQVVHSSAQARRCQVVASPLTKRNQTRNHQAGLAAVPPRES